MLSDLNLKYAKLDVKTECLCNLLQSNPLPPNSKKLSGDLKGKYSIRINLKHRLIYEIFEEEKAIKILSLWNHYDDN